MLDSLVSICIPTYNGAEFIEEAMESVLAQTYPNLEIVVSDDASVDSTLELIASYKVKTSIPIHIHHHVPNGIGANWNHCITKAKGKYIKFLFQDDVLMPECVTEMVKVIETDVSVAIVASKRKFIVEPSFLNDETERWIDNMKDLQRTLNLDYHKGIAYLDHYLFSSEEFFVTPLNKVGEPTTILFRKSLIDNIGYFREDLKQVLDYEFCYRVLNTNRIAIIDKPLVKFRLHNMQTTVKNKDNAIFSVDHAKMERIIYDNYFKYLSSYKKKVLARKYNSLVSFFYDNIDVIRRILPKKSK